MKRVTVLCLCILVTTSGCYFGRTQSAKRGGYVASGTAIVLGSIVLAAAASGPDCPEGSDISCGVGAGAGAAGAALLGVALIAAGGLGVLLNVVVPTKHDATPPAPPPGNAKVTTPGLPATQIELR